MHEIILALLKKYVRKNNSPFRGREKKKKLMHTRNYIESMALYSLKNITDKKLNRTKFYVQKY